MNYMSSTIYQEDLQSIKTVIDYELIKGKFLITGANGLIGTVIVDFLSLLPDVDLYVQCRSIERCRIRFGKRVKYIIQDVSEPLQISERFDYIIHAASNAHPQAYAAFPADTIKSNTLGTINILEFARNCNAKKVVFISSSEVYGLNSSKQQFAESDYGYIDILNPRSAYSEGKRAGETLCAAYSKQYGVKTVCVRPGYVFGPTYTKVNSRADVQFFRKAVMGEDIIMKSAGAQRRSYIYVIDCVSAILNIIINGENGAYNIAGQESVSIRQFAEMIASTTNVKVQFEYANEEEKIGYSPIMNSVLDVGRLSTVGFETKFGIMKGIEHTVKILYELKTQNKFYL